MPDMSGDAVAEEMRRLNPLVPLVLLSAYPTLPDHALQVVDKVMIKAQHPQVLLDTLTSLFEHRKNTEMVLFPAAPLRSFSRIALRKHLRRSIENKAS